MADTAATTAPGFTARAQERVAQLFIEALEEQGGEAGPPLAALLREKLAVAKGDRAAVDDFIQHHTPRSLFLPLAEADAKMIDAQWRARKVTGIMLLNALTEFGGVRNGDRFHEVVQRLKARQLPDEAVQKLVDDAFAWPSLTTHPTNPTSLAFTKAGLRLDQLLSDPRTTDAQLKAQLRVLIATSMDEAINSAGARRKTPQMEAAELIEVLSVIYHTVNEPRKALRRALDANGYSAVVTRPLLDIHAWGPGDGDGNPNMDAEALAWFLRQLRARITSLYVEDLLNLSNLLQSVPESMVLQELLTVLRSIAETGNEPRDTSVVRLTQPSPGTPFPTRGNRNADTPAVKAVPSRGRVVRPGGSVVDAVFRKLQDEIAPSIPLGSPAAGALNDLFDKYEAFGSHFAYVDIRHNSRDVMTTVGRLLDLCDALPEQGFAAMSEDQQANLIRSRLHDPSFNARVTEAYRTRHNTLLKRSSDDQDPKGVVATRIFQRMLVAGANLGRSQKFIIAETTCVANVLGALLLLKCGGTPVMTEETTVDVVPLFESRADLRKAPQMVHELLTDDAFAANCRPRGYLLAMIAKSDTARLSGAGVQGAQEETIGLLLAMHPANYGGTRVCIMLGGGDDQMRGGGRIVESPHVVMRAQAREGGSNASRIAMTLQGQQLQLVWGSPLLGAHFIEAFAAQMLLANARVTGLVPWRPSSDWCNDTAAAKQTHGFFQHCMNAYEKAIGSDSEGDPTRRSVVDYLNGYPQEIIEWTNKSSRPGARRKTNDPLQGRAISLDQLAKHDGAYLTATLGVAEALETLSKQLQCGRPGGGTASGGIPAHIHAYGNKAFRDFIRLQATVLFQKDYAMAWNIRGGAPGYLERQQLEAAYVENGYNPPRVFLAHQEKEDHKEAFLIAEIILRRRLTAPVSLKDPLALGWPQLRDTLEYRERQSWVAKRLELKAIRRVNALKAKEKGSNGDITFPTHLRTLAFHSYVGVNPAWASPNFALTMTDPTKDDGHKLLSESNPSIQGKLPKLAWLPQEGISPTSLTSKL